MSLTSTMDASIQQLASFFIKPSFQTTGVVVLDDITALLNAFAGTCPPCP